MSNVNYSRRSTRSVRPGSIVTSNTSGIPLGTLANGRSDDFRRHWLGTHFFNPPRYLHLLEVIPTPETSPEVVETIRHFADHRLGKGVVVAKDSPNFIGNHIGLYAMMRILAAVARGGSTIDEVNTITGPVLGRPKSATFRTLNLAGLDILGHVVNNLRERLGDSAGTRRLDAARLRCSNARARTHRGEGRPGILQTREAAERRLGHPHASTPTPSSTARSSASGLPRSRQSPRSRTSATGSARCSRPTTRLAAFSETHSRRRSCTREGHSFDRTLA